MNVSVQLRQYVIPAARMPARHSLHRDPARRALLAEASGTAATMTM